MKRNTAAIALSIVDYSNSSQVVSLLSREVGLLEGMAKGAHRPKSPFQGPFDLAVLYDVGFLDRRASGLVTIADSEVLDGFRGLRESWARHVAASQVIELLRGVSVAGERTPDLFDLACGTFTRIAAAPETSLAWNLLHFEVRALRVLGFLAPNDACVACGKEWPGGQRAAFFSPVAGGIVCRGCHRTRPPASDRVSALSGKAVGVLRDLSEFTAAPPESSLEERLIRQLHGCVSGSVTALLERPLRMLRYRGAWL